MDVREKLALSVCNATQKTNYKCEFNCEKKGKCAYCLVMAEQMIANGVTVQECGGCDICNAFISNDTLWKFCPFCGNPIKQTANGG